MSFNPISITTCLSNKRKNSINKFTVIKTDTNINLVRKHYFFIIDIGFNGKTKKHNLIVNKLQLTTCIINCFGYRT